MKCNRIWMSSSCLIPFFSITVLAAEAVHFHLRGDGFSWVTFKHVPDNHIWCVVITPASSCSRPNSNRELVVGLV